MILKDDGWYKKDKKGNLYQIAPPIQIVKKKINMETKEHCIVIDEGHDKTHEDTMETLSSRHFETFTKYSCAIAPGYKNDLPNELVRQTTAAQLTLSVAGDSTMGGQKINGIT